MKSIKNPRNHYSHVYRELFDGYQRLAKDKKGIQINQNSKLNFLKSVNKKNENRFNFKQNKISAKKFRSACTKINSNNKVRTLDISKSFHNFSSYSLSLFICFRGCLRKQKNTLIFLA